MLRWDLVWEPEEARVGALSAAARKKLATGCVDLAWRRLDSRVRRQKLLGEAVAALSEGARLDEARLDRLEDRIEESEVPGVWDLGMAVVTVARRGERLTADACLEAISFAYQAILAQEVLSRLEREAAEAEVREMEARSAACCLAIEEQLRLLSLVEADEDRAGHEGTRTRTKREDA